MRPFEPCFLGLRNGLAFCLVVLALPGCFVTIADPAAEATGGRPMGTGGGAGAGGSSGGGGNAGNPIGECSPGFADCDGKPENGCETDFREAPRDATAGTAAPMRVGIMLDGDASEWSGIPAYGMKLPCLTCRPDQPGGQNGEPIVNEPAGPADLTAVYRVAWDDLALYVLAQVQDDQVVASETTNLEKQDGLELLLDGDPVNVNPQYGPDVHHLFVGALASPGANVVERNQQLQSGDVKAASSIGIGARCYSVEMSFSWNYVMGRVPHRPEAGDAHGFTIAVNDWDAPAGADAAARPVRQTQFFSVVPGVNYSYDTTGFGILTLE